MRIPLIAWSFLSLAMGELAFALFAAPKLDWINYLTTSVLFLAIIGVTFLRSKAARWIYSINYVGGFALVAWALSNGEIELQRLSWSSWLMSAWLVVILAILWSPAMTHWIRSKTQPL